MRKLTEQHKKNISKALKGRMPKYIPDNNGRVRTAENKEKISDTLKRKGIKPPRPPREKMCRGKNHRWWKGGISDINERMRKSPEYKAWRKAVFERDNYTCIKCNVRGGCGQKVILHPHHIKSFANFPELRFEVDNGETLCIECHKQTDSYGKYVWGNEVKSDINLEKT